MLLRSSSSIALITGGPQAPALEPILKSEDNGSEAKRTKKAKTSRKAGGEKSEKPLKTATDKAKAGRDDMEKKEGKSRKSEAGWRGYVVLPPSRKGLLDLPNEVVEMIAGLTEKLYPLMMTCKQTCLVVGKMLYARHLPHTHIGTASVLSGLEHLRATRKVPFGSDLKRALLSSARGITYDLYADVTSDYMRWAVPLNYNDIVQALGTKGVSIENIMTLRFLGMVKADLRSASDPSLEKMATLIALLRPRQVCWQPRIFLDQEKSGAFYRPHFRLAHGLHNRHGPPAVPPSTDCVLSSESTWIPEVFVHHTLSLYRYPPVCHGALNRIYVGCYYQLNLSADEKRISCTAARLVRILKTAHPDISPPKHNTNNDNDNDNDRATLNEEETARRERTTWEFIFHICDPCLEDPRLGRSLTPSILVQKELELALPHLAGRVTVSTLGCVDSNEGVGPCTACGK